MDSQIAQLKKEVAAILLNNVNIVDQYDLKTKKDKPKDSSKEQDKQFYIKKYLNYPLKNDPITQMLTEKELRAALDLGQTPNK